MIAVNRNKYFIIPTIDIREVFNYNDLKISSIDERDKVINFRDKLIPIINFQSLIHNDKVVETNQEIKRYVIVVESKKNYLAIIFDDIIGYHPVVIKQMSELFSHLKEYNGCTILGNGDIGLILDIRYIVDKFQNLKIAV
jgi:two-component system chemotaxis sensor kinase CheA